MVADGDGQSPETHACLKDLFHGSVPYVSVSLDQHLVRQLGDGTLSAFSDAFLEAPWGPFCRRRSGPASRRRTGRTPSPSWWSTPMFAQTASGVSVRTPRASRAGGAAEPRGDYSDNLDESLVYRLRVGGGRGGRRAAWGAASDAVSQCCTAATSIWQCRGTH